MNSRLAIGAISEELQEHSYRNFRETPGGIYWKTFEAIALELLQIFQRNSWNNLEDLQEKFPRNSCSNCRWTSEKTNLEELLEKICEDHLEKFP